MARRGRAALAAAAAVAAVAAVAATAAALLLLLAAFRGAQPAADVLIVGRLTVDVRADRGGGAWTGGSVAFAAAAVRALGLRACVLTSAVPGTDLAGIFDGAEVIAAHHNLTFEHTERGGVRALRVLADDGAPLLPLSLHQVPERCRGSVRLILLGPLLPGDVDLPSFLDKQSSSLAAAPPIGLIAQGLQRVVSESGEVSVLPRPSQELARAARPGVSIFLSEEETAGWADADLSALAAACDGIIVTRGEQGAESHTHRAGRVHIPPAPGAHAVDSVGAGDTFAAAFMAARLLRPPSADAGRLAAAAAAAAVGLAHGGLNPAFGAAVALAAARCEPWRALLRSALSCRAAVTDGCGEL
jgi:hypothetical protein